MFIYSYVAGWYNWSFYIGWENNNRNRYVVGISAVWIPSFNQVGCYTRNIKKVMTMDETEKTTDEQRIAALEQRVKGLEEREKILTNTMKMQESTLEFLIKSVINEIVTVLVNLVGRSDKRVNKLFHLTNKRQ